MTVQNLLCFWLPARRYEEDGKGRAMKKKTKPTKEPQTDQEFVDALKKLSHELIDHDVESFSVSNKKTGAQTHLEATDYSSALFEAWHLVKD